jgi:hypothetical protein
MNWKNKKTPWNIQKTHGGLDDTCEKKNNTRKAG